MTFPNSGNCFKCAQEGHWEKNCELKRARTPAEHEARIRKLGDRWAAKEITLEEKTQAVKYENELWNSPPEEQAK